MTEICKGRIARAALIVLCAAILTPAAALTDGLETVQTKGVLRVAVYRSFAPFSNDGKGIDADLARALAAKLGVKPDVAAFEAGEELSDDLRNMVWKGHYLAGAAGDVMLHVPVDAKLAKENPQVRIVAPYYREQMAVLRNVNAVPRLVGLEAFTRVKIGVESDSLAQGYLLGALGGRFAANVVQFKTMELAVEAMKSGTVSAVLGSQTQIEAAAGTLPGNFELTPFKGVGLPVDAWDLGIAVKRDDAQLAAALEQAVQELMADGTLAQMFAREGVTWRPPKAAPGR